MLKNSMLFAIIVIVFGLTAHSAIAQPIPQFGFCQGLMDGTNAECAYHTDSGDILSLPERSIGEMYASGWKLLAVVPDSRGDKLTFYFERLNNPS